jgi:hypothetical protein
VGDEDTTLEDDPIAELDVVESEDAGTREEMAVDGRKTGLAPGEEILPLAERLVHTSEVPVPMGFNGDLGSSPGPGGTIAEAIAESLLNQPPAEVRPGLMGLNGEV